MFFFSVLGCLSLALTACGFKGRFSGPPRRAWDWLILRHPLLPELLHPYLLLTLPTFSWQPGSISSSFPWPLLLVGLSLSRWFFLRQASCPQRPARPTQVAWRMIPVGQLCMLSSSSGWLGTVGPVPGCRRWWAVLLWGRHCWAALPWQLSSARIISAMSSGGLFYIFSSGGLSARRAQTNLQTDSDGPEGADRHQDITSADRGTWSHLAESSSCQMFQNADKTWQ